MSNREAVVVFAADLRTTLEGEVPLWKRATIDAEWQTSESVSHAAVTALQCSAANAVNN